MKVQICELLQKKLVTWAEHVIGASLWSLTGQHVIDGSKHPVQPVEYGAELGRLFWRQHVYFAHLTRHKHCHERLNTTKYTSKVVRTQNIH